MGKKKETNQLGEVKERSNIMLYPSTKNLAWKKASKVAKRDKLKDMSLSKFIEIAINDYNAE